jgi:serine/threonine protein kinase
LSLDRVVALKLFHDQLERVLAANRAVARLQHPNLVQVIDCGEREDVLYVAEEYVAGGTLTGLLAAGPREPAEAAELIETVARALHHAHQHGVIHCNLKPGVVLLTGLGVPKVGSFDLAKLLHGPVEEDEGRLVGTPSYMAPEQAEGRSAAIGPATDVYGLGAILYQLLTGRTPFVADEVAELLRLVRVEAPEAPSRLRPGIASELEGICLKCLQKEPGRRYASAEELAAALHQYRAHRG